MTIHSENNSHTKMSLPILLGVVSDGTKVYKDITDAVHLLIAGSTGSGKSVFMNSLIASLIESNTPLKFCLIDPKKVELSHFSDLGEGWFFNEKETITDPVIALEQLSSLCNEMDVRYNMLKELKARNINEAKNKGCHLDYIVCVIDEFADLVMTNPQIEFFIIRLAQLGRACGIHLVIATQRPSASVISGLIKANFPTRVAFRTSSAIDSRIVLDSTGAEALSGRGEMLWQTAGNLEKVQGVMISNEELSNLIIKNRKCKNPCSEIYELGETEVLAARTFYEYGIVNSALLQRKLKLSYSKAQHVLKLLNEADIIIKVHGQYTMKASYTRFLTLTQMVA